MPQSFAHRVFLYYKCYLVNSDYMGEIENRVAVVVGEEIQISRTLRKQLVEVLETNYNR